MKSAQDEEELVSQIRATLRDIPFQSGNPWFFVLGSAGADGEFTYQCRGDATNESVRMIMTTTLRALGSGIASAVDLDYALNVIKQCAEEAMASLCAHDVTVQGEA